VTGGRKRKRRKTKRGGTHRKETVQGDAKKNSKGADRKQRRGVKLRGIKGESKCPKG